MWCLWFPWTTVWVFQWSSQHVTEDEICIPEVWGWMDCFLVPSLRLTEALDVIIWSGRLRLQQYFMAFLASLLNTMRKKKTKGPWGLTTEERECEDYRLEISIRAFPWEEQGSPAHSWSQRTGSGKWSCRCWRRGAPGSTWPKPERGRRQRSSGRSCRIGSGWGRTERGYWEVGMISMLLVIWRRRLAICDQNH